MDEPHWVKRFTEHGAPGAYLRVVVAGAPSAPVTGSRSSTGPTTA